jgi:hypothetical protein
MITAAALTFPHLQACVTILSGQCDAPVRQTVVTCSNAIQVTIYNCRSCATIALARCPFGSERGSVSNSHRPSSEGTFRVDAPQAHLFTRWIEAKHVAHGKFLPYFYL